MINPTIERLSSGLIIASDFIPSAETIAICIFVKTGARNEDQSYNGLSHFLEHMAFKGTNTRTAKEIAEAFDSIGGQFNAYTSYEETVYYAKVLKDDWIIALDILTDIVQNSIYSPEEMDKERGVILQEIAQYQDMPDSVISDNFQETAYPNQPLGRTILGTPEFINTVSRDDLYKYVQMQYNTRSIIVSASGNLHHKTFSNLVQKKLNKIPDSPIIDFQPAVYVGGESKKHKDLEQVNVYLGFKALPYTDERVHIQRIASLILGGGMSSRLFQEIRENLGLAYHISSFSQTYCDTGVFSIFAGTNEKDVNLLIDASISQIHLICQSVSSVELERAKAQIKASLLMSKESVSHRAEKLAANIASFDRYITTEEILEKINKVTEKDVCDMMKFIISEENSRPTIATLGKISKVYDYDEIVRKINGAI